MTISPQAIEAIKKSVDAQAGLMVAFKKSHRSIEYWLDKADIRLTTATAVKVIKENTGLTEEEILVNDNTPIPNNQ